MRRQNLAELSPFDTIRCAVEGPVKPSPGIVGPGVSKAESRGVGTEKVEG